MTLKDIMKKHIIKHNRYKIIGEYMNTIGQKELSSELFKHADDLREILFQLHENIIPEQTMLYDKVSMKYEGVDIETYIIHFKE